MRIGSLFAGIGGFDLAARWVGWQTAWFSEVEPYASAVLAKHWPGVPNYGDIRQINGHNVPPVDALVGGFPCQDISLAGKGAGLTGERSGLWFEYARLIEQLRPRYVVAENVAALRSRGLDQVLGSLAALGYDAEWHCIPAAAVGAPHRRDRLWLVGYPNADSARQREHGRAVAVPPQLVTAECLGYDVADTNGDVRQGRADAPTTEQGRFTREAERANVRREGEPCSDNAGSGGEIVAHADSARLPHLCKGEAGRAIGSGDGRRDASCPSGFARGAAAQWWATEPDVGRVAHGVPARVDRLRCLGNSIVPQVALVIFQAIEAHEQAIGEQRRAA